MTRENTLTEGEAMIFDEDGNLTDEKCKEGLVNLAQQASQFAKQTLEGATLTETRALEALVIGEVTFGFNMARLASCSTHCRVCKKTLTAIESLAGYDLCSSCFKKAGALR